LQERKGESEESKILEGKGEATEPKKSHFFMAVEGKIQVHRKKIEGGRMVLRKKSQKGGAPHLLKQKERKTSPSLDVSV